MKEAEDIFIEGSSKSPQIDFSPFSGELILQGRSIPEDATKVFEPLLDWVNNYIRSPRPTTNIRLNLEYFNTASLIWITRIIKALCRINNDEYLLFIHIYLDESDFENIDKDELKDIIGSLVDNIGDSKISIGVKAYATGGDGEIVKESLIFI